MGEAGTIRGTNRSRSMRFGYGCSNVTHFNSNSLLAYVIIPLTLSKILGWQVFLDTFS